MLKYQQFSLFCLHFYWIFSWRSRQSEIDYTGSQPTCGIWLRFVCDKNWWNWTSRSGVVGTFSILVSFAHLLVTPSKQHFLVFFFRHIKVQIRFYWYHIKNSDKNNRLKSNRRLTEKYQSALKPPSTPLNSLTNFKRRWKIFHTVNELSI